LYIIEHIEVADEFIISKHPDLTQCFIIKPKNSGRLKKADLGRTPRSGSPDHMRQNACYRNLK